MISMLARQPKRVFHHHSNFSNQLLTASQRSFSSAAAAEKTASPNSELSQADFLKAIRKPDLFFDEICKGVQADLRAIPNINNGNKLEKIVSSTERAQYLETIFTNMAFAKPVATNFMKSDLGLPTMSAAIYSHMFTGLTNHVFCLFVLSVDYEKQLNFECYINFFN